MKIKMKVIEYNGYPWFMFGLRYVDYSSKGICFREGIWVPNHDTMFGPVHDRKKAKQTLRIINRMKKWK